MYIKLIHMRILYKKITYVYVKIHMMIVYVITKLFYIEFVML
jgi:hypothetical protein